MKATLDSLNRYDVVLAIASGSYQTAVEWARNAPGRIIASAAFPCERGRMPNLGPPCFQNGRVIPDPAWLRAEHRAGRLEPVLRHHPRLRVYLMHAGWPYLDQLIGLLYAHPQVYVDVAVWWAALSREEFDSNLLRLVRAGYGKRIMYGSDLEEMGKAIEAIESTPGLTEEEKTDIFHDNAARFLRLRPRSP